MNIKMLIIDVLYVCMYVFGGCAAVTNNFPQRIQKFSLSLSLSVCLYTFIYRSL